MSKKYPGGVLSKTAPVPSGPFNVSTASGMWTMDDVAKFKQQGTWPTAGNTINYIDDVFSTDVYTGNGSTQTITNGIDLSTKGGLVWIKGRTGTGEGHTLFDTARGVNQVLQTQNVDGSANFGNSLTAFNSTGFTLGTNRTDPSVNYVSWTFRKQPKFFDVVTYTGDGTTANRQISHSLGSEPGMVVIKRAGGTGDWYVTHRSRVGATYVTDSANLNSTAAFAGAPPDGIKPSSTTFSANNTQTNTNGSTYVAYLFAHNAGGFGETGTDNVISCGSYTGNLTVGNAVELGYEPQWVLIKRATGGTGSWYLYDIMRGMTANAGGNSNPLNPNASDAEGVNNDGIAPSSTGFTLTSTSDVLNGSGITYIYMAIRRSNKPPTVGTSVFNSKLVTATQSNQILTGVGFSPDLIINGVRSNANYGQQVTDRLRGVRKQIFTEYDSAENTTNGTALVSLDMDGFTLGSDSGGTGWNAYSGYTSVKWCFKRASRFFDQVCYTGTGVATTQTHNLGAVPELIITKTRTSASGFNYWFVYHKDIGQTFQLLLNGQNARDDGWGSPYTATPPTSSVFSISSGIQINQSGITHVSYLFASLLGVSKVGSYIGTATTKQIDCGFTAGARFVLIKRTDSTGDWFVWDTARGIVAGNDPYLRLNSASVEETATDYIDTYNAGFEISSTAPAAINASGGTYIFLAIA